MDRSFHFIPANKKNFFDRVPDLEADQIIFDLEDAVPQKDKDEARTNLFNYLKTYESKKFWIRCNPIKNNEFVKDLFVLNTFPNIGIVLPKIENVAEIKKHKTLLNRKKIILIESFHGLMNMKNILDSLDIYATGLGLEDMFSGILIENAKLNTLSKFVRLYFVCIAKAFNTLTIDGISNNFTHRSDLITECKFVRELGFDAKFSIHPFQINIINNEFKIDEELIHWAQRIKDLTDFQTGFGYTKIDGEVITPPKIEKAKNIITKLEEKNE